LLLPCRLLKTLVMDDMEANDAIDGSFLGLRGAAAAAPKVSGLASAPAVTGDGDGGTRMAIDK
jgi:hypothetical protein